MNALLEPRRPPNCLSDFVLDQLVAGDLTGASEAKAREHLAGCERCGGRLDAFMRVEPPPLVPSSEVSALPSQRRRAWMPTVLAAAAALLVAAIVLVALPLREDPERPVEVGTRTKSTLTLGLIVRRASGDIARLAPGDVVLPGESFRFEVAAANAGFVAILGIDAAGAVTIYAPTSGTMAKLEGGRATVLEETIVADDALGAERVTALLCPEQRDVAELRTAGERALKQVAGDPRRIQALGTTCAEAAVVIDKRRVR
jgi:hypothetical protein